MPETKPSAKWLPSPDQRQILEALQTEASSEKSAAEFCRSYCDFGPSKFSKILNALDPEAKSSYFDEITEPEAEIESLEILLSNIRLQRATDSRREEINILPLSPFRAIRQAVRECINKPGPERVIKYLAPSGGGKSMLCNYLAETQKAKILESRQAWRKSYFTVLTDFARAAGVRMRRDQSRYPAAIEDELIKLGNTRQIIIAIDEGEFFGPAALNGIKLLLNKAKFVFIICAIAEAHQRWNEDFRMEADQITRRTHTWVELTQIIPADAALFFADGAFADPEESLKTIALTASQFGHYSLIARVAHRLRAVKKAQSLDVEKALAAARREMLQPLKS